MSPITSTTTGSSLIHDAITGGMPAPGDIHVHPPVPPIHLPMSKTGHSATLSPTANRLLITPNRRSTPTGGNAGLPNSGDPHIKRRIPYRW